MKYCIDYMYIVYIKFNLTFSTYGSIITSHNFDGSQITNNEKYSDFIIRYVILLTYLIIYNTYQ